MSSAWWLDAEAGRELVRSRNDPSTWPDPEESEDEIPDDVCSECYGIHGEHKEGCPNAPQEGEEA